MQVTHAPLDLGGYKLSPDGKQVLLSYEVFTDCADPGLQRAAYRGARQGQGQRHALQETVRAALGYLVDRPAKPAVRRPVSMPRASCPPSRPCSVAASMAMCRASRSAMTESWPSPDGKTVYFDVRIAGTTEPWSTNFDVYSVPADGSAAPTESDRGKQGVGRLSGGIARRQDAVLPGHEDAGVRGGPVCDHGAGSGHGRATRGGPGLGSLAGRPVDLRRWKNPVRHRRRPGPASAVCDRYRQRQATQVGGQRHGPRLRAGSGQAVAGAR